MEKVLVEDRIKRILADQLGVKLSDITPSARIVDDLGADSLDTVELVMALEEEFGFEMPDEDAERMRTIRDIVDYIQARIEK